MKALMLCVLLIMQGCALQYMVSPIERPSTMEAGRKLDHGVSAVEYVPHRSVWLNTIQYTVWEGEETFSILTICPTGLPGEGELKSCFQSYGGVKVDGSESIGLQTMRPGMWDLVFEAVEQSAFRWKEIVGGVPDIYNMAGQ